MRPNARPLELRSYQFRANRILAALPSDEIAELAPHLTDVRLDQRRTLFKPDQRIRHVYFPDAGVCSVMIVMQNGASVEVGTVGNEGMIGLALYLGDATEPNHAFVQVPGYGRMLPADVFQEQMARQGALHQLVGYYAHSRLIQIMQSAACNQLHSLEERACRWILMTHDRVHGDSFRLTHELLALMLGARRSSVTAVANRLQRAGCIEYRHGAVTVTGRARLEARACECYRVVRDYFDRPFRSAAVD